MSSENLKWIDIVSPTLTKEEYNAKFGDEETIKDNYSTYNPKSDVIQKITEILSEKKTSLKIMAMGAAWCKDCKLQIPHLLKIVNTLPSELVEMKILYGIKTDPYRKAGDIKWSARHSPPEAINPKFAANKIPMIYFFDATGDLLAMIEERPRTHSTIEEVLLAALDI